MHSSRARMAALAAPTPRTCISICRLRSIAGSCAQATSRSLSTARSWLSTRSRRAYSLAFPGEGEERSAGPRACAAR
jgi:hypothetical protein